MKPRTLTHLVLHVLSTVYNRCNKVENLQYYNNILYRKWPRKYNSDCTQRRWSNHGSVLKPPATLLEKLLQLLHLQPRKRRNNKKPLRKWLRFLLWKEEIVSGFQKFESICRNVSTPGPQSTRNLGPFDWRFQKHVTQKCSNIRLKYCSRFEILKLLWKSQQVTWTHCFPKKLEQPRNLWWNRRWSRLRFRIWNLANTAGIGSTESSTKKETQGQSGELKAFGYKVPVIDLQSIWNLGPWLTWFCTFYLQYTIGAIRLRICSNTITSCTGNDPENTILTVPKEDGATTDQWWSLRQRFLRSFCNFCTCSFASAATTKNHSENGPGFCFEKKRVFQVSKNLKASAAMFRHRVPNQQETLDLLIGGFKTMSRRNVPI